MKKQLLVTLIAATFSSVVFAGGELAPGESLNYWEPEYAEQVTPGEVVIETDVAGTVVAADAPVVSVAETVDPENLWMPAPKPAEVVMGKQIDMADLYKGNPAPAVTPKSETDKVAKVEEKQLQPVIIKPKALGTDPRPVTASESVVVDKQANDGHLMDAAPVSHPTNHDSDPEVADKSATQKTSKADFPSGNTGVEDELFDSAAREFMPLSPDEVRQFRIYEEKLREAKAERPYGNPKGVTVTLPISLAPGVDAPEILTSDSYVTTIVMLDSLGNPWPIKGFATGDSEAFKVTAAGENVLLISPLKPFASGNMVVTLKDETAPVVFDLHHGIDSVHYRVEAKIQKMGPSSAYVPASDLNIIPDAGDNTLQSVLDGVPQPQLETLEVTGGSRYTTAYKRSDGRVYLRTPYSLLWPSVIEQSKSSDGTHVYVFESVPAATLSANGVPVMITINSKDL